MEDQTRSVYKLVRSGDVLELFEYENAVQYGKRADSVRKVPTVRLANDITTMEKRSDNVFHARQNLWRLILANSIAFSNEKGDVIQPYMVTFTFADNVLDRSYAVACFTKAVAACNRIRARSGGTSLRYVAVIEKQSRGAYHIHCVVFNLYECNNSVGSSSWNRRLSYVRDHLFSIGWPYGWVDVSSLRDVEASAHYVAKYLTKQDVPLGKRSFFSSRGLLRPVVERDEEVIERYLSTTDVVFLREKRYTSVRAGVVYLTVIKLYDNKREIGVCSRRTSDSEVGSIVSVSVFAASFDRFGGSKALRASRFFHRGSQVENRERSDREFALLCE